MRRIDITVLAIRDSSARWSPNTGQRRHLAPPGTSRRGDYELADTLASLAMGVRSLLTPMISTKVGDPVTPTKGRHGKDMQPAAHRHPRVGGDHPDIRGARTWRDGSPTSSAARAGPHRQA